METDFVWSVNIMVVLLAAGVVWAVYYIFTYDSNNLD